MEQIVRDARAAMLYEGANGVQALDLAGRKLLRDKGATARRFFDLVDAECQGAPPEIAAGVHAATQDVRAAAEWLLAHGGADAEALGAGSYPFLEMVGILAIGWMWARMATVAAEDPEDPFLAAKLVTARHYVRRKLPFTAALRRQVETGPETLMALPAEAFLPAG